jgi:hypothetical protein
VEITPATGITSMSMAIKPEGSRVIALNGKKKKIEGYRQP